MKVVATLSFSFLSWAALGQVADLPKFRHVTIDANVKIGYGTAIADMNGDKKTRYHPVRRPQHRLV